MNPLEETSDLQNITQTVLRQARRIAHLEDENESLNSRLNKCEAQQQRIAELEVEVSSIRDSLKIAQQRLEKSHGFVEHARLRYDAAKKSAKEWKTYIERQRLRSLNTTCKNEEHNDHSGSNVLPTATPQCQSTAQAPTQNLFRTDVVANNEVELDLESTHLPHDEGAPPLPTMDVGQVNIAHPPHHSVAPQINSSQSTQVDPQVHQEGQSPNIKDEAISSDEIEVISARPVKRNRPGPASPPKRIKQEPTSPKHPFELNSDDYASPRLLGHALNRFETSDLDAIVNTAFTPRKPLRAFDARAISEECPLPKLTTAESTFLSDGDVSKVGKRGKYAKKTASVESEAPTTESAEHANLRNKDAVLQPLSPNVSKPPRQRATVSKKKRSKPDVNILAEDGVDQRSQFGSVNFNHAGYGHAHRVATSEASKARLEHMLEDSVEDKQPIPRRKTPKPAKPFEPLKSTPHTARPPPTFAGSLGRTSKQTRNQYTTSEKSPAPIKPDHEPLRKKSLTELKLGDFKVNPKYMGTTFAFADSLRTLDEKRCAAVCTKPGCCSDEIKRLVEAGVLPASRKSDRDVLEGYLGPGWEAIISTYGPEKRKEMLETARAYALSAEHGRHHQAFERHSTPPGFWDVDFPDTQQRAANCEKADKMQRQQVEQRYYEALRANGRWIFRDE